MKILAILVMMIGAARAGEKSFKGWELYSWKCKDTACFALVVGTNRNKTVDEIHGAAIDLAAVEKKIDGLAAGEQVSWGVPDATFAILEETAIRAACDKRGVKLVR
ncbi:MAG: hypothetical protein QM831_36575 [Kofleriaceae bacterium]